jgi:outer membrane protein OmpA-like peptidoglycan-associated protein
MPQESIIVGNAYTLNPTANTSDKNKDTLAYINVSYLEKIFSVDKDSFKVDIEPLNINTEYSEFAPVMTADGEIFYFTSNRPNEFSKKKNKNLFENIYVSYRQKNGFSPPQLLSTPININNRHNSAIGLSNDGQTMFLYRDDEKGTGDIYISKLSGTNWSEPEKLPPPVNSEYHESSASLSPDGKILFFISERPGGKGKKDIWYAVLDKNGKWTSAKPLNDINTPMDEESVFMHPDGKTLYFSSKGYKGFGGYDIYKTTFEKNGKCTPPENLENIINSPEDDFYYMPEANGKVAYFTSKRNGNADLFKVTITPIKVKKDFSAKLTLFKGKVIDKSTQQPLEAEIEITDLSNNTVVSKAVSNSATGNFLISLPFGVNYGINVKKEGYLFYSENVYVPKTEDYKELIKLIELEKIKVGERIILKNIFFEFDKADLLPESKMELDRLVELLNRYPAMKIEISGHTDSKGNDEYNLKLSQARAQAVVDYLISKGISKDRLQAKGYGETKPIAPNQNPDGSDNEEGRQLNRRTEFKILEY